MLNLEFYYILSHALFENFNQTDIINNDVKSRVFHISKPFVLNLDSNRKNDSYYWC